MPAVAFQGSRPPLPLLGLPMLLPRPPPPAVLLPRPAGAAGCVGPAAPAPPWQAGRCRMQNTLKWEFGSPSILAGRSERHPVSVAQRCVTGVVRITIGPAVAAAIVKFPPPLSPLRAYRKGPQHARVLEARTTRSPMTLDNGRGTAGSTGCRCPGRRCHRIHRRCHCTRRRTLHRCRKRR